VFGAGWGVAGAAVGTTLATAGVTLTFAWGTTGRSYFGRGASPVVPASWRPPTDFEVPRQLLGVSAPLVARRIAQGVVIFPLLAIAATFGPVAVAAVGVGRQVRALINSFSWGFSIAASTLVGQRLGAGEETEAEAYGRDITKLSFVVYVVVAVVVILLAEPIATVFVDDPGDVALSTTFVRAAAVSVIPLGVNASLTGVLRGAGDTTVPFVATLVGLYVVALPTAWLGTVTTVGVTALAVSLVVETVVPTIVDGWRFRSNRWKAVSREYRPSAGD
jgi:putative MATE family efflux protein